MQYTAVLAVEEGTTLVFFPDCPGCQTEAEPGEDIAAIAREALEGWLASHLANGEVPPAPSDERDALAKYDEDFGAPTGTLPVRISPALAVRIQLRRARVEAGLSQADLAGREGVSRQQITLLESPDSNLTLETLVRVAGALGLDVDINLVGALPTTLPGVRHDVNSSATRQTARA